MKFDIQEILGLLPHRYPFLLIDRIVEFEPTKRLVAIKNVTINEPFFQGHFPGYPIMPGVLVVEAMAQAGGIIMMAEIPDRDKKLVVFTGIERAKFRRPVTPGDQLRIEVEVLSFEAARRPHRGQSVCGRQAGLPGHADLRRWCRGYASAQPGRRAERRQRPARKRRRSEHPSQRCDRAWSRGSRLLHRRPILHHRPGSGAGRGLHADFARGAGRAHPHRRAEYLSSLLLDRRAAAGPEVRRRTDRDRRSATTTPFARA